MQDFRYFDAHVHLDWFDAAAGVAHEAQEPGLGMFACTVEPAGYATAQDLAAEKNVLLAAGFHPWWVAADKAGNAAKLEAALVAVESTRWVGEIGLDFGKKHVDTKDEQVKVFKALCEKCAATSEAGAPKVLSIHSVGAADCVMDILEETGAATSCRCVLHWFSGTSNELARARDLGLWFSFGEKSLATRRGREYARQVPVAQLLTETDFPEGPASQMTASDILTSLKACISGLAAARGESEERMQALLTENARHLVCYC